MLQELSDESRRIKHRKDKGDGCRQHPCKREQCADRKVTMLRVLGTTLQPQGKEPGQRDTTMNHGRLGGIRQTPGYHQKQPCHLPEETGVQLMCATSYDILSDRVVWVSGRDIVRRTVVSFLGQFSAFVPIWHVY